MVNLISIILVLIGAVVGAGGAVVLKKASSVSLKRLWYSRFFWGGFSLYGLSTVFYILALRNEALSIIYPLVSTTYIWTTIFSVKFLGEKLNKYKIVAVGGIILGVILIGFGS